MARSRTRLVIAVGAVVLLAVSVGSMMLAKPLHAKLSTDVYAKFHSDTPISKQSVEGGTREFAGNSEHGTIMHHCNAVCWPRHLIAALYVAGYC